MPAGHHSDYDSTQLLQLKSHNGVGYARLATLLFNYNQEYEVSD